MVRADPLRLYVSGFSRRKTAGPPDCESYPVICHPKGSHPTVDRHHRRTTGPAVHRLVGAPPVPVLGSGPQAAPPNPISALSRIGLVSPSVTSALFNR